MRLHLSFYGSGGSLDFRLCRRNPGALSGSSLQMEFAEAKVKETVN